ncbi:unnamed protein product [Amoebophrya sp. A120]|nr:unnamed protein product [Amoebophrya sp. A120]|eukprot:GSA120T00015948001.1
MFRNKPKACCTSTSLFRSPRTECRPPSSSSKAVTLAFLFLCLELFQICLIFFPSHTTTPRGRGDPVVHLFGRCEEQELRIGAHGGLAAASDHGGLLPEPEDDLPRPKNIKRALRGGYVYVQPGNEGEENHFYRTSTTRHVAAATSSTLNAKLDHDHDQEEFVQQEQGNVFLEQETSTPSEGLEIVSDYFNNTSTAFSSGFLEVRHLLDVEKGAEAEEQAQEGVAAVLLPGEHQHLQVGDEPAGGAAEEEEEMLQESAALEVQNKPALSPEQQEEAEAVAKPTGIDKELWEKMLEYPKEHNLASQQFDHQVWVNPDREKPQSKKLSLVAYRLLFSERARSGFSGDGMNFPYNVRYEKEDGSDGEIFLKQRLTIAGDFLKGLTFVGLFLQRHPARAYMMDGDHELPPFVYTQKKLLAQGGKNLDKVADVVVRGALRNMGWRGNVVQFYASVPSFKGQERTSREDLSASFDDLKQAYRFGYLQWAKPEGLSVPASWFWYRYGKSHGQLQSETEDPQSWVYRIFQKQREGTYWFSALHRPVLHVEDRIGRPVATMEYAGGKSGDPRDWYFAGRKMYLTIEPGHDPDLITLLLLRCDSDNEMYNRLKTLLGHPGLFVDVAESAGYALWGRKGSKTLSKEPSPGPV